MYVCNVAFCTPVCNEIATVMSASPKTCMVLEFFLFHFTQVMLTYGCTVSLDCRLKAQSIDSTAFSPPRVSCGSHVYHISISLNFSRRTVSTILSRISGAPSHILLMLIFTYIKFQSMITVHYFDKSDLQSFKVPILQVVLLFRMQL